MGTRLLFLLLVATALPVATSCVAQSAAPVVLRAEVVVRGEWVTLGDLSANAMDPPSGELIVMPAPRPGYAVELSQGRLRRELSRAGIRPLPRLDGPERIMVRSPGRRIEDKELQDWLTGLDERMPLPGGAVAQKFVLAAPTEIFVPPGTFELHVSEQIDLIGLQPLRVLVKDGAGRSRNVTLSIRRSVKTPVMRAREGLDAHTVLLDAMVQADTLWVDDAHAWRSACRSRADVIGRTVARSVERGSPLQRSDLRETPVVWRGSIVEWTMNRGSLQIRASVKARGQGGVGDWIYVEGPFDRRLHRVCIHGPSLVGSKPVMGFGESQTPAGVVARPEEGR